MLKDNLVMLRNIHRLSQEEVAEKVNISRQAYAKWEKGETVPDVEKCSKLAELYDTTIDSLLHFEQEQEGMTLPPAPKGKSIWGSVIVNERGQIVIPKAARDFFSIQQGDRLIVLGEEQAGIALVKAEVFENNLKNCMELAARCPDK